MKIVIVLIPVVIVAMFLAYLGAGSNNVNSDTDVVFHVTLANPAQYTTGLHTDSFTIPPGEYLLRFVPNGDSPQDLTVSIDGPSLSFTERFVLSGTLHDTGISEYHTWEYIGNSHLTTSIEQQVEISINPHGNIMGPVSVSLIKN